MGDLRRDMQGRDTYIGDGVYASFDGFQIKLRTERDGRDEIIYLDPDTYTSLVRFAQQFYGDAGR